MRIAFLLYDGHTGLDAIGPFEVLSRMPDVELHFLSKDGGLCRADTPVHQTMTAPLEELPDPDLVLVPGGSLTWQHLGDEELLGWLRTAHATSAWTTSVCTGSLLLGAAGLLTGRRATSHFYELESLSLFGATPVAERVVWDGKLITAAGVSAGIDMALELCDHLHGVDYTQAVQLAIEYSPQPPFDSGSTKTASPETIETVRSAFRSGYGPPWVERVVNRA